MIFLPKETGIFDVILEVIDSFGESDTDTAQVTVLTPEDGVAAIIAFIEGLGLPTEAENMVIGPLSGFDNANVSGQCNKLGNFINPTSPDPLTPTERAIVNQLASDIQTSLGY